VNVPRALRGLAQHLGLLNPPGFQFEPLILLNEPLRPWQQADRSRCQWVEGTAAPAANALGTVTFTVGADELWHVHAYAMYVQLGANVTGSRLSFGIRPNGTALVANGVYGFESSVRNATSDVNEVTVGRFLDTPVVAAGGDVLLARFFNGTGAAVTVFAAILREIVSAA
jgi:hypothetical protein